MAPEQEVLVLFAVVNGSFDDVAGRAMSATVEAELLDWMSTCARPR